jgi:hypothetical protein
MNNETNKWTNGSIFVGIIAIILLAGCSDNITNLKTAKCFSFLGIETTIESILVETAGVDGSVQYHSVPNQPLNTSYKYLGASVTNKSGKMDCTFLVNTANMTGVLESINFNNKILTFTNNTPDDEDIFWEFLSWNGIDDKTIQSLKSQMLMNRLKALGIW